MTQPSNTPEDFLKHARLRAVVDDQATRVCLARSTPLTVFFTVLVIAIVLIAFSTPALAAICNPKPIPPSVFVAEGVLVLAIGLGFAAARRRRIAGGTDDLVVEAGTRTLVLPATFDRAAPVSIRFDAIDAVDVAEERPASDTPGFDDEMFGPRRYVRKPADPDDFVPEMGHRSNQWYAVIVYMKEGPAQPITAWTSEQRARGLVFWLRDQLATAADSDGGGALMDLLDRLLGHDAWTTRELLVRGARGLSEEDLDRPFDLGPGSVRATFEHVVYNVEAWFDEMSGRPLRPRSTDLASVDALIARLDAAAADFASFARSVADRDGMNETWTATRGERTVERTYGGTIAHVVTHGMHHRAQLLFMLRRLGVEDVPEGDVLSWEREARG